MFISVENVLYFLIKHCEAEHFRHMRPEAAGEKILACSLLIRILCEYSVLVRESLSDYCHPSAIT